MRLILFLVLCFCSTVSSAEGLGGKNPDVPYGGLAIDFLGAGTVYGKLEQTEWDYLQQVGATADGLPVSSNGDLSRWGIGLSLMTSLSSRVTAQVHYNYARTDLSNIDYTAVGLVQPPNIRDNHGVRYKEKTDLHTLGVRLRVWVGAEQ